MARNTLWNILGASLPLVLAVVTLPVLIRGIGTERFGVLAIAWVILGYFGLFDFGLGRATTKFLAEDFEHGRVVEARALFWTSLLLNGALGVLGGLTLGALSPWLVNSVLNVPPVLQVETLHAFYLMAASVPLVTLTTAARGALEARHSFRLLNVLQVPTSALTQMAPLLVLPFSRNLAWLVGALAISRLLGTVVFLAAALRRFEAPLAGPFFVSKRLRELFSYGGWLTVTNVIGPLMVYADRFVIGSLASMSAVTFYATPYEAVTRLWVVPLSLTRTLFPIFSAGREPRRTGDIYPYAVKYLALFLTPVVLAIVVFAPDLLRLWIGETFARRSTLVLQILVLGVLANSLALVPYTLIQALGRPDITAKFHILELPFYLFFLWYGASHWGIVGAAIAWATRVSVDGVLLALYVRIRSRVGYPPTDSRLLHILASISLLLGSGWALSWLTDNLFLKIVLSVVLCALAGYGTWRNLLTRHERERFAVFNRDLIARTTGAYSASGTRRARR